MGAHRVRVGLENLGVVILVILIFRAVPGGVRQLLREVHLEHLDAIVFGHGVGAEIDLFALTVQFGHGEGFRTEIRIGETEGEIALGGVAFFVNGVHRFTGGVGHGDGNLAVHHPHLQGVPRVRGEGIVKALTVAGFDFFCIIFIIRVYLVINGGGAHLHALFPEDKTVLVGGYVTTGAVAEHHCVAGMVAIPVGVLRNIAR